MRAEVKLQALLNIIIGRILLSQPDVLQNFLSNKVNNLHLIAKKNVVMKCLDEEVVIELRVKVDINKHLKTMMGKKCMKTFFLHP